MVSDLELDQVWEDVLETWPDVAQKLRPSCSKSTATPDVPSLEEGKKMEATKQTVVFLMQRMGNDRNEIIKEYKR